MTRRVIVIGGGISGLSAAHALREAARSQNLALDVRLFERAPRVGGVVRTSRRGGVLFEHGPDSFITQKPWALDLCRRLGIVDDQFIGTPPAHRRSLVVYHGRPQPLPQGIYLLAPTSLRAMARIPIISKLGKLRMALDLVIPRRRQVRDESLASFVRRRLGREALERLAEPMAAGIYAADPRRLSLQATFPQFLEMEREHGSLIRALHKRGADRSGPGAAGEQQASGARYGLFVSFRDGMQTLTDALATRLVDCVQTSVTVRRVVRTATQPAWRIEENDGRVHRADALIVALPAWAAAPLLTGCAPALAKLLGGIAYAWSATVNLVYRRRDIAHPLDAMGLVVPAVEAGTITACSFSSVKFAGRAPPDLALLRAFLGARRNLADCSDDEIKRLAHTDLKRLLGIFRPPLWADVTRHAKALPRYDVGHVQRVARIRHLADRLPGLALAGNAFAGVGIPDCIHSGEQAAAAILRELFG